MTTCITTQTAGCWPIPNEQHYDVVGNEEALAKLVLNQFEAKLRTKATGRYNCHGLTFGARRTCIDDASAIWRVLEDDGYKQVQSNQVMPGDVVLYFDQDGTVTHSGIVVEISDSHPKFARVVSKWGVVGAEYLHWVHRSPYGLDYKFYRVDYSSESAILSKIILSD